MREILFKGIREDNKEWIEGFYHYTNWMNPATREIIETTYSILPLGRQDAFEVISETIGQYTGVNDINANKIFEHDIVRKYVDGKELIGVVEFSDGAFGVRFADSSGQLLCFFGDCCEVIGNIHNDLEITLG